METREKEIRKMQLYLMEVGGFGEAEARRVAEADYDQEEERRLREADIYDGCGQRHCPECLEVYGHCPAEQRAYSVEW